MMAKPREGYGEAVPESALMLHAAPLDHSITVSTTITQRILLGHSSEVHALEFVDNPAFARQPLLLSGDVDGRLCVWDARAERKLCEWQAHTGSVTSFHYFSDAQEDATRIIFWSHGRDGFACLWSMPLSPTCSPADKLHSFPISGSNLCRISIKLMDRTLSYGTLGTGPCYVVAGSNVLAAEKIDIFFVTGRTVMKAGSFELTEELLSGFATESVVFDTSASTPEAQKLLQTKAGMAMSLQLLRVERQCKAPVISKNTTATPQNYTTEPHTSAHAHAPITKSQDEALSGGEESLAGLLGRYKQPHAVAGPSVIEPDTSVFLIAGFENGRAYLLNCMVHSEGLGPCAPAPIICSAVVCGTDPVLDVSVDCSSWHGVAVTATNPYCIFQVIPDEWLTVVSARYVGTSGSSACKSTYVSMDALSCIVIDAAVPVLQGGEESLVAMGIMGSWDGTVRLIRTDTGKAITTLRPGSVGVYSLALWQNVGRDFGLCFLACGDKLGKIALWHI